MNIAIDIDGTITKNPKLFLELMLKWKFGGNEVVLLTGNGDGTMTRIVRLVKLKELGIPTYAYTELVIARDVQNLGEEGVAKEKARLLIILSTDIFIDDNLDNIREAKKRNPKLLVFEPY